MKKFNIYRFIGVALLCVAAGMAAYKIAGEKRAGDASDSVVSQMDEMKEQSSSLESEAESSQEQSSEESSQPESQEEAPAKEMPVVEVDGHPYIGQLEIKDLWLKLPIMSEGDEQTMKITPCRYKGSVYEDNMIIMAHNYKNHFGKIGTLEKGSIVIFTDNDGIEYVYEVAETELLLATDVEKMEQGDWDLTLFTCNKPMDKRITVRFNRVNK